MNSVRINSLYIEITNLWSKHNGQTNIIIDSLASGHCPRTAVLLTFPPCCTDKVVCFTSWAVPPYLHTLLFPSFWCKLICVSFVHGMLFRTAHYHRSCDLVSVYLCLFWWSMPPGKYSWSRQILWRGFAAPGKQFFFIHHSCFLWSSGPFDSSESLAFCL